MAKVKSKKKGLSDLKNESAAGKKKLVNRFEVHVNRQKFAVLGRSLKTDRGMPYVARAKGIKRRKETLLQEYKVLNKSNKFMDRRIGEFNKNMTPEDKIIARFAAERSSSHRKKAMFNLAEDEPLTHKGRSIMDLETFDDPESDGGDDDFFDKNLDGKFVEEAHFGGGMLKKAEGSSRMAVIDQLIAESKQRKAEKAAIKEQTCAATERLDSEWRDLLPVMGAGKFDEQEDIKKDEYDKILGSLKFEPRGTPSDRLKSENEVAEAEAKRLRELEEDRIRRMKGTSDSNTESSSKKHRSADDLDDGFDLSSDEDEEAGALTYDDEGKLVNIPKAKKGGVGGFEMVDNEQDVASSGNSDSNSDDDDDDDEESEDEFSDMKLKVDSEDESEGEAPRSDRKELKRKIDCEDEEDESERNDEKPVENEALSSKSKSKENKVEIENVDAPSKLKKSKKSLTEEDLDEKHQPDFSIKKKVSFNKDVQELIYEKTKEVDDGVENTNAELEKKILEDNGAELPYTYSIPAEYEEFESVLGDKSLLQQSIIIERMIKCSHPSLKEGNKSKLELLFTFILQKLNDADYSETWPALDAFAPYLFDLTQFFPSHAADCLCEVLSEKFSDYTKKKTHYPYPDTLVFLKLVPLLFPTSDKRHQVTTPATIFILSMLSTCRPNTRRGIACGLFLCALLTQYVSLSKRIAPEAISYLNGIFRMTSIDNNLKQKQLPGPFLVEYKYLFLSEDLSEYDESCKMSLTELGIKGSTVDDEYKIKALYSALSTLETFYLLYQDKPEAQFLFNPVHRTLKSLTVMLTQAIVDVDSSGNLSKMDSMVVTRKMVLERYPKEVAGKIEEIIKILDELKSKPLPPLVKEAAKPKSLRMYEPNIKPVFDKNKIKDERIRLKRKLKKETKGALREIRKDRAFIAGVRFKEQKASDELRMQKVKEIYGWGAQQQGELNKMDRIKRRKKFKR